MTGKARWPPRLLCAPGRGAAEGRYELERALHDDVAIGIAALAMKLDLISASAADPEVCARIESAREVIYGISDGLRGVGAALYPPVLYSAGLGPALGAIAERRDLRLRLDLPKHDIGPEARARAGLLVADHLHTLGPGAQVLVRVRGRRFVRVRIIDDGPGRARRRDHLAVLRCG